MGGETEKRTVVFHEFADEEEGVECHDAITDQACDVVSLGVVLTLQEYLVPEGGELGIVLLEVFEEFVFALTDLIECAIFSYGFLDW